MLAWTATDGAPGLMADGGWRALAKGGWGGGGGGGRGVRISFAPKRRTIRIVTRHGHPAFALEFERGDGASGGVRWRQWLYGGVETSPDIRRVKLQGCR